MDTVAEQSSTEQRSLLEVMVRRIFRELQGNYGSRFLNQWKTGQVVDGHDTGMINAMRTWGKKLAGFSGHERAISRVLEHLPPEPPTLPAFLQLCRDAAGRQNDDVPRLPHRMTPEEKAKADEAAKRLREMTFDNNKDPKAWAYKLKKRHESGEALHPIQISSYRAALGIIDNHAEEAAA